MEYFFILLYSNVTNIQNELTGIRFKKKSEKTCKTSQRCRIEPLFKGV